MGNLLVASSIRNPLKHSNPNSSRDKAEVPFVSSTDEAIGIRQTADFTPHPGASSVFSTLPASSGLVAATGAWRGLLWQSLFELGAGDMRRNRFPYWELRHALRLIEFGMVVSTSTPNSIK